MEERVYQVALGLIPGIGEVLAKNLISYCGSASGVFQATSAKLKKIPGIGAKTVEIITRDPYLEQASRIVQDAQKSGITLLHYTDKEYPSRLKQQADSPNILYLKGAGDLNPARTLAIVGTRNATEYGKEVTEQIVAESSGLGLTILSGLAYGIDIQAHKASLKHQVPTWAVLGSGLNKIYPSIHKKVATDLQSTGYLISEVPPNVKAEAHYFPERNRIIAGLSDAVLVVEAAEKGGALITAQIADSYNKTVFAVPGNLKNTYSEGCNYLIRNQKAIIYTGVSDLIFHMSWDESGSKQVALPTFSFENLSDEEKTICTILAQQPTGIEIDQLAWKSQIGPNKLASILLTLEFSGVVKSLPGKKFQLR